MKDTFKLPGFSAKLPSMGKVLTQQGKQPRVGVTQGGSSRKNSGAKSAGKTR